jgi:hypothetical protein
MKYILGACLLTACDYRMTQTEGVMCDIMEEEHIPSADIRASGIVLVISYAF